MTIQFVGSKTFSFAGTTSTRNISLSGLTGGIDTSPSAGDFVIVGYGVGSFGAVTIAINSSYTNLTKIAGTGSVTGSLIVGYKFMPSTPDSDVNVSGTNNSNNAGGGTILVFRGVDPTTPMDATAVSATGSGSMIPNPGAITPVTSGAFVVAIGAGGHNATVPAYTSSDLSQFKSVKSDDTYDIQVGGGYIEWSGSGSVNPATFTQASGDSSAYSWAAYTLALRPAPSTTYDDAVSISASASASASAGLSFSDTLSFSAQSGIAADATLTLALAASLAASAGLSSASGAEFAPTSTLAAAMALASSSSAEFESAAQIAAETGISASGLVEAVAAASLALALAKSADSGLSIDGLVELAMQSGYSSSGSITAETVAALASIIDQDAQAPIDAATYDEEVTIAAAAAVIAAGMGETLNEMGIAMTADMLASAAQESNSAMTLGATIAKIASAALTIAGQIGLEFTTATQASGSVNVIGTISLPSIMVASASAGAEASDTLEFIAVFDERAASNLEADSLAALAAYFTLQSAGAVGERHFISLSGRLVRTVDLAAEMDRLDVALSGKVLGLQSLKGVIDPAKKLAGKVQLVIGLRGRLRD